MIESHGLLDTEHLERANESAARAEARQDSARFAEYAPSCIDCGRIEGPGEEFEDNAEGFPICPFCVERRLENDELSPVSMLAILSRWYKERDRAGASVKVPLSELKEAIIEAAKDDPYTNQYPWESGAEWDARRTSGR